jgi:hypothetical protein
MITAFPRPGVIRGSFWGRSRSRKAQCSGWASSGPVEEGRDRLQGRGPPHVAAEGLRATMRQLTSRPAAERKTGRRVVGMGSGAGRLRFGSQQDANPSTTELAFGR